MPHLNPELHKRLENERLPENSALLLRRRGEGSTGMGL